MDIPSNDLTQEQLKIYDRQRFIGLDVQKKLVDSNILLSPLNGVMSELAKNLILMGCNLTLFDAKIIDEEDVETNFLFCQDDIGKNRAEIAKRALNDINPLVKITEFEAELSFTHLEKEIHAYDIVALSAKSFNEIAKYDSLSKKFNKPIYILLCCGLYGFFYCTLGSSYHFNKSGANKEKIPTTIISSDFEKILSPKNCKNERNRLLVKEIFLGLIMLKEAEKNKISYNPENEEDLEKLTHILGDFFELTIDQKIKLKKFAKFYGIEFCPVYSIIGSVASQEFIKVIGKSEEPSSGWFVYDSEEGYGKIENF